MAPQSTSQIQEATPVILEKDGAKMMRLEVCLSGYSSDDVIVQPADCRLLLIHKADSSVLGTFNLPESVDPFTIEAVLSEEGVLRVEAPLVC